MITLAVICALCKLGLWQLERAEQKQNMLNAHQAQLNSPFQSLEQISKKINVFPYKTGSALLSGQLNHDAVWLLDNVVHQGKVGYDVVTLLENETYTAIINLGWVAGSKSREHLPHISLPKSITELDTVIKFNPEPSFRLAALNAEAGWPKRIQSIDIEQMAQQSKRTLLPVVLYAMDGKQTPYQPHYQIINMRPEKHHAYAVQWFSLAVAALCIFIFASWKRPSYEKQ